MSSDRKMLAYAAREATKGCDRPLERRGFLLGAVGVRNDGVLVTSRNVASPEKAPNHHAEARVVRKLTPGSTVWVARVSKQTGEWVLAKPCRGCENRMRAAGVERVVYTISAGEWGTIEF